MTAQGHQQTGEIGGKAANLLRLERLGMNVPRWMVVPANTMLQQIPRDWKFENGPPELECPDSILMEVQSFFGEYHEKKTYAVRSSALDEDGVNHSFAGMFQSHLHVPYAQILTKVKEVWQSAFSSEVMTYRHQNHLEQKFGIAVIIQEMIPAEVSGVAFGLDPVTGDTSCKVISSLFGLGEGLVSGALNADSFKIGESGIETQLVQKEEAFSFNTVGSGLIKVPVPQEKQNIPSLNRSQIQEITEVLERLEKELASPQDVEFCYAEGRLYLLQTRPITTQTKERGEYLVWDNSNIIESYPGITTPLTFSFILKMYEHVYRQFVGIMGVRKNEIERHAVVFANTLGLVRGRVYYNLKSWYQMLAMLPGYALNAENMERMMGVKERFELEEDYQMSKSLARWRLVVMSVRMLFMLFRLNAERKSFLSHLDRVMAEYQALPVRKMTADEIIHAYQKFESTLLLKWKAPLINDFFAMIWFGILHKLCNKHAPDQPNLHNDLLCGSQDIISVEPIHRSIAIAKMIMSNREAKKAFLDKTPDVLWNDLIAGNFPEIKQLIDDYLDRFGDRCVGELKLETVGYAQDPTRFVQVIKSYVEQGVTNKKAHGNIEEDIRLQAEEQIKSALGTKWFARLWFGFVLKMTRKLVSNRENLRYERTRGFGMVRKLFVALGEKWHAEGHLESPRDIFYLELQEIKSSSQRFDPALNLKIEARKSEFEKYQKQPPPQARFFTYGHDFKDEYIYSLDKVEDALSELQGTGCCPGLVRGKVRVVQDPYEVASLNGDILVTTSTDPGWVVLFPTASAIMVERGSLLSHSAIVSREMGIPCIVGVTGLLRTLKSGDEVLMDGSTGQIKILNHA